MMRKGVAVLILLSLSSSVWATKARRAQSDYGIDTNPIKIFTQAEFDDPSGVHVKFEEICSDRENPQCDAVGDPPKSPAHDFIYQLSLPEGSTVGVSAVTLSAIGSPGAFSSTPLIGLITCTPAGPGETPPYPAPCSDESTPLAACVLQDAYVPGEAVSGNTYTATFPFDVALEGCTPTATFTAGSQITLYIELDPDEVTTPPTLVISAGPPHFSLLADPTNQTITAGSSATYTISVDATNGFDESVSLTCSDVTSIKATCSFSPVQANPLTPTTLTISTTAPTMVALGLVFSLSAGLLVCLTLISVGGRKSRFSCYLAVALVAIAPVVSCGGNQRVPNVSGTPKGSHKVTVSATASTGIQTLDVTLTVQ
jgi:hypothetical protein